MLEVDIILNGGGHGFCRCVQRLAIWNVSELADVSEYEYALSEPTPMGRHLPSVPDGIDLARGDAHADVRGSVGGYERKREPWELVLAVLEDVRAQKDRRHPEG